MIDKGYTIMPKVVSNSLLKKVCNTCNVTLEFDHNELEKRKVNWDYLGDYDTALVVDCPVCESEVIYKIIG